MKSRYTLLKINSSDDYLSWVDSLNGTRLFALFDAQSKLTRLDEIESRRWGPAINLYGDLEGTRIAQLGPRIIEANDTGSRSELVELAFSTRASLLAGNCTLEEIAIHLKDLREIALPDGTPALFRFQDARVAVATFPTLNPAQGCKLLGPLTAWAVLDVCHRLHVRSSTDCRRIGGRLRFNQKTVDAIDEQLFVHTIAEQVRDTDAALLGSMSECQIETRIRQQIERAKALGLVRRQDQSLHSVLSFQFPSGFENEVPFASAIRYHDGCHSSFGDALDAVPSNVWDTWDERLSQRPKLLPDLMQEDMP